MRGMLLTLTAAVALWSAGCSTSPTDSGEAPVQEMSDARQAIEAARVAGSPRYTPERFREAQYLMEQAMLSLSQGEYQKARDAAVSARARAISARKAALAVQRME
ncbi:MAG TPA: DUF4398 domain-containing protein [Nitrococcus sp.]|nr:DUF4398 domain-containing protein [Nitrococcus sp.]